MQQNKHHALNYSELVQDLLNCRCNWSRKWKQQTNLIRSTQSCESIKHTVTHQLKFSKIHRIIVLHDIDTKHYAWPSLDGCPRYRNLAPVAYANEKVRKGAHVLDVDRRRCSVKRSGDKLRGIRRPQLLSKEWRCVHNGVTHLNAALGSVSRYLLQIPNKMNT